MKWHFSPQLKDQVETEVTQRDQFNNDDVDLSETIVREAVQNSLDAAVDDSECVTVTFRWQNKDDGLSPAFFSSLFEGQLPHAEAAGIDVNTIDLKKPGALIIEDFGTTGLTGSVEEKDDNHFSDFWRRHGKSHKSGKSRGRWGLGKLVYSASSQIGVFFGVTRRDDDRLYLMGQTVLNLRKVDGRLYPPHGFFADVDGQEDDLFSRITVPVRDEQLTEQFIECFSLNRRDGPGLSVIIPFPDATFNVPAMIKVAIENYFYPLTTGQLILKFDDIEINGDNIFQLAKEYARDTFPQLDILFEFIREIDQAERTGASRNLALKPSWMDDRKLDDDDFDPKTLEKIRARFSSGEMVSLWLPVTVKPKNGPDVSSGFSVYIKRPE